MMLEGKIAVVYGGGGKVGGAVAKGFAADGARVFLAGRTLAKVEAVAAAVRAAGGTAEAAQLDVLDVDAVNAHLAGIVEKAGRVDVSFNGASFRGDLQGKLLRDMPVEDFLTPVTLAARAHFITGTAAARQMVRQHAGVIVTLSASATALSGRDRSFHKPGGFGVACAAIEEFSRTLAGELGVEGVRVVCIRSDAISETWPPEEEANWRESKAYMDNATALGRLPRLAELAGAAVFAASDKSSAMTGAILNLTCGSVMERG